MSVNALNSSISAARADGNITAEEAKTFTSPQILGAYTDKDEFQALSNLAGDIRGANTVPKPKEKQSLVKRGINIGAIIGGTIGGVQAVSIITAIAAFGFAALGGAALVLTLPVAGVVLVGLKAFVGVVVGIGALGGYIHSKVKGSPKEEISAGPVTADLDAAYQIEKTLDKGVTTKSPVKKGMKIGGAVGGVLGGLGLGAWVVGSFISVTTLPVFFPVAIAALVVAGVSVGIGALAGFIHSKRTTQED